MAGNITGDTVTYSSGSTSLKGYLATDGSAAGTRPGVIVVHEWWGHNDYAQDWRTWMSKGILDATFPMLYIFTPENFPFIAREHLNDAYGRWVLPGINTRRRTTEEILELVDFEADELARYAELGITLGGQVGGKDLEGHPPVQRRVECVAHVGGEDGQLSLSIE